MSCSVIVNPYWIEDRDLGPGQIDYLPGVEVQFWKDLIEKYLEPLMADKAKEKQKANELLELRNQGDYDFLHIRQFLHTVVPWLPMTLIIALEMPAETQTAQMLSKKQVSAAWHEV